MTDPTQRILTEFGEDDVDTESENPDPERNAADIQHLVECVENLTDQVGTLTTELEGGQTASINTEPTDETRMFH